MKWGGRGRSEGRCEDVSTGLGTEEEELVLGGLSLFWVVFFEGSDGPEDWF